MNYFKQRIDLDNYMKELVLLRHEYVHTHSDFNHNLTKFNKTFDKVMKNTLELKQYFEFNDRYGQLKQQIMDYDLRQLHTARKMINMIRKIERRFVEKKTRDKSKTIMVV